MTGMASKGLLLEPGGIGAPASGKGLGGTVRDLGSLSLNLSKVSAGLGQASARGNKAANEASAPTTRMSARDLNPISNAGPVSASGALGAINSSGKISQLGLRAPSSGDVLKTPGTIGKAPLPTRETDLRLPLDAPRAQKGARTDDDDEPELKGPQAPRRRGSDTTVQQRRQSLDSAAEAKEEPKATKGSVGGKHRAADSKASAATSPTSTDASLSPREPGVAGAEAEVRREAREQAGRPDLDAALEKQREGARARASLSVRIDTEALTANTHGHHLHRLIVQAAGEAGTCRLSKVMAESSGWAANNTHPQGGFSALHLACYLDRRDVVRLLLSQWTHEVEAWYTRRVKALQARLQACAYTSTSYDANVVGSIREWVVEEIARLGRVRELQCEDLWMQAVTWRDRKGRTPLHYACSRGSISAAMELMSVGMGHFQARTTAVDGSQEALFPRNRSFHPHSGAIVQDKRSPSRAEHGKGRGQEEGLLPLAWVWKRMDLCVRTRLAQGRGYGRSATTCLLSLFEEYDPKGTGAVTLPEFHRALRELGLDVTEETEQCLAKLFTHPGDHRHRGGVDYDKLVRMFQSEEGLPSAAPRAPAPACVDAEPKENTFADEAPGHKKATEGKDDPEGEGDKDKAMSKNGVEEEGKGRAVGEPKAGADEGCGNQGQQERHGAVTVAQLMERRRRAVMDAVDKEGYSPLHHAAVHAHVDLLRLLLTHNATQELRSTRGETALSLAWNPVIQKLLTAALVNKLGESGASGLQGDTTHGGLKRSAALASAQACSKAQVEACMKVLVESGFRLSEPLGRIDCRAALHVSAITASISVTLSLIDQDVDVNSRDANGWTALHYCALLATHQHYTLAKALLEAGAEPGARSKSQRTPLHLACSHMHNKSKNKNAQLQLQLQPQGAGFSRALFVTLLAGYGADVEARDNKGYTPLHVACEAGSLRCLAALVDGGAHLFAETVTGANGAHLTVASRRRDVLRFLCEVDAEEGRLLRSRDRAGRTPLELCVDQDVRACARNVWEASGRLAVGDVKAMLLHSSSSQGKGGWQAAGIDSKTARSGYTALHMAIRGTAEQAASAGAGRGKAERLGRGMVAFLLSQDAFVDSLDKLCRTPLMLACAAGLSTLASLLLTHHADPSLTDIDGNSAMHHAYAHSRIGLVPLLETAGGDPNARNVRGQVPEEVMGVGARGLRLTAVQGPKWETQAKGKGKGMGKGRGKGGAAAY